MAPTTWKFSTKLTKKKKNALTTRHLLLLHTTMTNTVYFLNKKPKNNHYKIHNEFEESWNKLKSQIEPLLRVQKVDEIVEFIYNDQIQERIPTGLILSGPDIASHTRLFNQLRNKLDENITFVSLNSVDCTSLKTCLKKICTASDENYKDIDLDILVDKQKKITILVEDAVSFDSSILSNLIKLLCSYIDKVELRLLFNIATSAQVFQSKLPQWCIRLLKGHEFQAEQVDIMKILWKSLEILPISPEVFDFLINIETINAFLSALKYSYMTFYYSRNTIDVVKKYPSFQSHVENNLESIDEIKRLLTDQEALQQEVEKASLEVEAYLKKVQEYTVIASFLHNCLGEDISHAELYRRAVCGEVIKDEFASRVDEFDNEQIQTAAIFSERVFEDTGISARREFLQSIINDLITPRYNTLYLYEHFFFENSSLLEQVFQPNIRSCVENTLAEPHITSSSTDSNANTPPHIAILYQLYRESPVVINTYDLFQAFHEYIKSEDESETLAYFLQGISELKSMGFLKDSRRQYESVEKLLWKDL